ncbi:hypothetical protein UAY_02587 [Enterococcus moraviensis ATCC BAA-383]|uniref:DUF3969 family protein n=1 Tax=Enterococcus moraviensis ATCC BAA-383 TaxID=1158609 RepID=R2SVN4_9ENTE|nr:DUF3969 family protein [Enterococcus moraviensis]EOH96856.1 hypothetical protein UAY_02587 [Enterococcus moraviensis ATCC BAA-383]EOT71529.1 hypothetical protein I586_01331 [Enterococcus moraviensis ATCC BAA-383]OJG64053.1 hypothetical protein RV09_GL001886 [Enterococcus moraviensis]
MKLKLSANKKNEAERLVLTIAIGLLESLENGLLTINDCENYLFSPCSVSILEEKGLSGDVIEIVELGCELEDIQSLRPAKLKDGIRDLKEQSKE